MTRVRSALGDEASESAQTVRHGQPVGHVARRGRPLGRGHGMRRRSNKYDEALRRYSKAVELDPKFGLGYAGLANVSANLATSRTPRSTSRRRSATSTA